MTRRRAAEVIAPGEDQSFEREILELRDGPVEPRPAFLAIGKRRSSRAGESGRS
jgi:hypothetical protein